MEKIYDTIIIGGGPAGLSAALLLGRCKRSVLLFDNNEPRNYKTKNIHGFLSRDGISPFEFIHSCQKDLEKYEVEIKEEYVIGTFKKNELFKIYSNSDNIYFSKKLIIATGLKDKIPDIQGMDEIYGTLAFHCPYCDGWEFRDKTIVAICENKKSLGFSLLLKTWSEKILLLTNGIDGFGNREKKFLLRNSIIWHPEKILNIIRDENGVKINMANNRSIIAEVIFFKANYSQKSSLGVELGCEINKRGLIKINRFQKSTVKGVYVCGDASRDIQMAVIAAAGGVRAGIAINTELIRERSV